MGPLQPGESLDHYQIEKLVARSGMASVFRATDSLTGAPVALKIPHPEAEADVVFFDRFKREQQIGQELDHPYVMKVFPNTGASRVYMVMEWIDGRLLREILFERKKLPLSRALDLVRKICQALDHVHAHGVIHRDLKPENIMVDDGDHIKLIDFGIAGKEGARRLTFGKLSEIMGTPDYIAPEQVRGKRGDCRSDIYAVGVMLYEMLTGTLPFRGSNPLAIMNDRLRNDPVPPRDVAPEIPLELEAIIYHALERDPKNRYATARDFAHDLEHPETVMISTSAEPRVRKHARDAWRDRKVVYVYLALLPILIFALLLWVAHHP